MATATVSPIDAIRQRQQADAAAVDGAFQTLVIALANGESVDPSEANRVLTAAGRTPDELETAVSNHGPRLKQAATVLRESELPALDAEQTQLLAAYEAAVETRRQAEQKEVDARNAMQTQANQRANLSRQINEAKQALRTNADLMPIRLGEQYRELKGQLDNLPDYSADEMQAIRAQMAEIGRQSLESAMRLVDKR